MESGMLENINCEVITPPPSRTNGHLITFIDTPGLVDGSFGVCSVFLKGLFGALC